MNDMTPRLALPMIVAGQAQKEMTHNEALVALDAAVQASVVSAGLSSPPIDPTIGDCWIVDVLPTGLWTGHAGDIAAWTPGGWRFVAPRTGFRAWVANIGMEARFVDGAWMLGHVAVAQLIVGGAVMLASPVTPIDEPSGGSTIDAPARTAIAQILAALRHHNLLETA